MKILECKVLAHNCTCSCFSSACLCARFPSSPSPGRKRLKCMHFHIVPVHKFKNVVRIFTLVSCLVRRVQIVDCTALPVFRGGWVHIKQEALTSCFLATSISRRTNVFGPSLKWPNLVCKKCTIIFLTVQSLHWNNIYSDRIYMWPVYISCSGI